MLYESTRGKYKGVSFSDVIKMGISPDGGLFVPSEDVEISKDELLSMVNMDYKQRAVTIFKYFATDFSDEEIKDCVDKAYSTEKFDDASITPVKYVSNAISVLELWHGPTCAFKDLALQILPHFMTTAIKKTNEKEDIFIVVATSGDTGKAALEGFKNVNGTRVCVFFPLEGVSDVQKLQMITQEGDNLDVVAIEGNFDDAQTGVKKIFADDSMADYAKSKGYKFSSANSINWGRLMPQIVYYFSSYCDLVNNGEINFGDKINFVIPTGNFGNILAAYYAKKMGLPINRLISASNSNNVVFDFIRTGVYNRNRDFYKTKAPAMDILISSNVERLIYDLTGRDSDKVNEWMDDLKSTGKYKLDKATYNLMSEVFWSAWANEDEINETIKSCYYDLYYLVDTHTAVGFNVYDKYVISTGDVTKTIIDSTASPFKFNKAVVKAIFENDNIDDYTEFELLDYLSDKSGWRIPDALKDLDKKPILHKNVCNVPNMSETLKELF